MFRQGAWRRILRAADIGHWRLKDLRDTFASQLLTLGIPIQYIARQLGHAKIGVTEDHYAKWLGEDDLYVHPPSLEEGEVPADLLARLPERSDFAPTSVATIGALGELGGGSGRESNPPRTCRHTLHRI